MCFFVDDVMSASVVRHLVSSIWGIHHTIDGDAHPSRRRVEDLLPRDVFSTSDDWLFFLQGVVCQRIQVSIDLLTARPKWRLDGPALSGHLLYLLVNHAYANRYGLSSSPSPIIGHYYYYGVIWLSYYKKYSSKRCVNHKDQDRRACCR